MSRAWMPIYWGDYLADTLDLDTLQHGAYILLIAYYWQHGGLPTDDHALSKICKASRHKWTAIKPAIARKFTEDWRHKRIDKELAKIEVITVKRQMAGAKGGFHAAIARAKAVAFASQHGKVNGQHLLEQKDRHSQSKKERGDQSAGLLASALPTGALARPPNTEQAEGKGPPMEERKPPSALSRAELDAIYASKRGTG